MGEVKEYVRTGLKLTAIAAAMFVIGYIACYKLAESKYNKEMQELDRKYSAGDITAAAVKNAKAYGN